MRWRRPGKPKASERPSEPSGQAQRDDSESSRMMHHAMRWARRNAIMDRVVTFLWFGMLGAWIVLLFSDGDASARIIRAGAIGFYIFALLMVIMARRTYRDVKARQLSMKMAEQVMQEITSQYIWGESFVVTVWNRADLLQTAHEVGELTAVRGVAMAGRPPWAGREDE